MRQPLAKPGTSTSSSDVDHLQTACARSQGGHAQRAGRAQHSAGVMRLQRPAHLPRQSEGRQLRNGQHLRARTERVPAESNTKLTCSR